MYVALYCSGNVGGTVRKYIQSTYLVVLLVLATYRNCASSLQYTVYSTYDLATPLIYMYVTVYINLVLTIDVDVD
jgi:hypothetical protein